MERLVCGVLVAVLHAGAVSCTGGATSGQRDVALERSAPVQRALLVRLLPPVGVDGSRQATILITPSLTAPGAIELPPPILPEITPIAADSFQQSHPIGNVEDAAKAQRLQGLYVGQIKARLLRALEGSRDAYGTPTGHCVVYVVQDERGAVLDIMSDECTGDERWRRDVEGAIRRASPLPLPPEGLAMGSYLTLDLSTL